MSRSFLIEIAFDESLEKTRLHWREELRRLDGVDEAQFASIDVVGRSTAGRNADALDFGKLLLTVAPNAIKAVLGMIASLAKRPGAPPVKLKVAIGDSTVEMELVAHDLTPEALASVAERLVTTLRTAQ